jgi:NAD(P)-dependent dehydrogenase (short-subunit alcohol dehydrogenase family)
MKKLAYSEITAVLSGSSDGIALKSAMALARVGVPRIVLNGRTLEKSARAIEAVRAVSETVDVKFVVGDMTRGEDATKLVTQTIECFSSIELLVNSIPSITLPKPFSEAKTSEFHEHFQTNFLSVLNLTHAALPHMTAGGGGTIVSIASDAGKVPTPGQAIIGGFKAAIAMFSRTLALEVARFGIRVHCLTPSLVRNTRIYDEVMADPFAKKLFQKAESRARLGLAEPEDLADLIVYLSGPSAAHMTGQVISINGGISAG